MLPFIRKSESVGGFKSNRHFEVFSRTHDSRGRGTRFWLYNRGVRPPRSGIHQARQVRACVESAIRALKGRILSLSPYAAGVRGSYSTTVHRLAAVEASDGEVHSIRLSTLRLEGWFLAFYLALPRIYTILRMFT